MFPVLAPAVKKEVFDVESTDSDDSETKYDGFKIGMCVIVCFEPSIMGTSNYKGNFYNIKAHHRTNIVWRVGK